LSAQKQEFPKTFPEQPLLLEQAQIGLISISQEEEEEAKRRNKPDFVLFRGGKIEVFEATLDVRFEVPEGTTSASIMSKKNIQFAYIVTALARRFPGVPIT
jgi:hypothetical protein